ncbi:putative capsid protein [Linepithema humile virus 1]|nr:putative capsid protein [Linepithema humile virus 1]
MDDTHSIVQFLERPVQIDHFTLDTKSGDSAKPLRKIVADVSQPQPFTKKYSLPSLIIQKGGKADKMENFKYFKANMKIKVVLNANPFVAGRFYLTYSPYEEQISPSRQQKYSSRAGVTAYPGVEIDIQLDNSVEIEIPYASYREAYDLTRDDTDYVTLYLYALTELMGPAEGTTTFVDFTFFAWFTNVEIVIPTYQSLPTTLSLKQPIKIQTVEKQLSKKDNERILLARNLERLNKTNKTMYDYIMNVIKPKDVSMQIQSETGKKGPISEIASGVGNAASAIGGIADKIPILGDVVGSVAKAVETGAAIVGGIASILGWSKPHSMDKVNPLVNIPGLGYTHYKGIDMGVPLALTVENELGMPTDVFPSKVDEMDLSYICSNPGVKAVIKWGKDAEVGIPLKSGKESGDSYNEGTQIVTIATTTEEQVIDNTDVYYVSDTVPCEYVSSLFSYWRATICFKISVVKTAFHVGRLEILFDPNMYPRINNDKPIVDDQFFKEKDTTNNYRYILDLTNETEITIRIPYVSAKQFLSTQGLKDSDTGNWNEYDFENCLFGCLYLRPLTKILAPETVSDYVNVIVWKWAENVALACPKNGSNDAMTIYEPVTQVQKVNRKQLKQKLVKMQINISNKASGNVETFFQSSETNTTALLHGCGETIENLRVLCRTFRKMTTPISLSSSKPAILNVQEDNEKGSDYLSYLSYMYRFFRGGVRYKCFSTGTVKTQADSNNRTTVRSALVKHGEKDTNMDVGPTHITFVDINPVHEVTVPFYSQYRKLPISLTADKEFMQLALSSSGDNENVDMFRSGNDDFTFGWLVGTPQLVTGSFPGGALSEPPSNAGAEAIDDTCHVNSWYVLCGNEMTATGKQEILDHPFYRFKIDRCTFHKLKNPNIGAYIYEGYVIAIPIKDGASPDDMMPNGWFVPYANFIFNKNVLDGNPGEDAKVISLKTHRDRC